MVPQLLRCMRRLVVAAGARSELRASVRVVVTAQALVRRELLRRRRRRLVLCLVV